MVERWAAIVDKIEIRDVSETVDLHQCEAIQEEAWGYGDREMVPASQFRAVQQAAGMVLGAYRDDLMLGFAYGFLARDPDHGKGRLGGAGSQGSLGLHSHMVAVRPEHQSSGIGRKLKWAQREWCLARDLSWMHWTFDPIQAKNARLNLHHLGGYSERYLVDFYGVLGGRLSGSQPSDRLLVQWDLDAPEVVARAQHFATGLPLADPEPTHASVLLGASDSGWPALAAMDSSRFPSVVSIAVPTDATALLRDDPEHARAWRLAVREAMVGALHGGFRVTGFAEGAFILQHQHLGQPAGKTKPTRM